ncbi:MAG: hypothetical protein JW751_32605 [Polyangiaceae bacterium]|nr:hypothetical protein [Polyangiaceae bacterium]
MALRDEGLVLNLPDAGGWSKGSPAGPGFHAVHRATRSVFRLRTWAAVRSVTPAECAERARLFWPELPTEGDPGLVDSRPLVSPPGYRGRLVVVVEPAGPATLDGRLGAVGASLGRCLAVYFQTRAGGTGAELAVAESLALVASGTVDRLDLIRIEDRLRESRPEYPFTES